MHRLWTRRNASMQTPKITTTLQHQVYWLAAENPTPSSNVVNRFCLVPSEALKEWTKKWTVPTLTQLLLNIWIKPCASYQKESNGEVIEWKKAWMVARESILFSFGVQYYGHHQFNFNYVKLVGLKLMPSSILFIALNLQPLVVVAYLVHTSLHTTSESDWLKKKEKLMLFHLQLTLLLLGWVI